jgi:hypothetical protein
MPTLFPFYLNVAAKVTVSDFSGAISFDVENLDGEGLFMDWDVQRQLGTNANQGTLEIYNLGELQQGLMQSIVKASAGFSAIGNIELSVGWDGQTFSLMRGQIWRLQAKVYRDPDIVTVIEFGDGVQSNRDSQTLTTQVAQIFVTDLLTLLASRFSPPRLLDVEQVNQAVATSPNGLRTIGNFDPSGKSAKETFDEIVSGLGPDYSWGYGENGLIVVYNRGQLSIAPGTPPELISPDTGLLDFTEEDNGSVRLSALANPAVREGVPVAITDRFKKPVGQPVMRVESASFTGNTRGDNVMTVVARPLQVIT